MPPVRAKGNGNKMLWREGGAYCCVRLESVWRVGTKNPFPDSSVPMLTDAIGESK
jgi:hypothetical protein